jgi:uncharacterized protein (TIGR04222 family)
MKMNTNELAVWQRLESYVFDKPEHSFPFSAKLRRETGWSASFASQAIEEYRRFTFLFATSGHPVSPSDSVDQVWHMHLMYTEEYWKVFCAEALQKPLHHSPSIGGASESAKFEDWYEKTLDSYRKAFGEEPPVEYWPVTNNHPRRVKIDTKRYWIISKDKFRLRLSQVGLAAGGLAVVGCSHAYNPFEKSGPEFLETYGIFGFAMIGIAGATRWLLANKSGVKFEQLAAELNPYDVAFLRGGRVLALNTLFGNLIAQKVMRFDKEGRTFILKRNDYVPEHPLEKGILNYMNSAQSPLITNARAYLQPLLDPIEFDLERRGLILSKDQIFKAKAIPSAIVAVALLPGLARVAQGIENEKAVGYLVLMLILGLFCSLAFWAKFYRSAQGRKFINYLSGRYYGWRFNTTKLSSYQTVTPLLLALFGAPIMEGTPFEEELKYLQPNKNGTSGMYDGGGCSSGGFTGCGGELWGSSDSGSDGGSGGGGDGGGDGGGCGGCGGD